MKRVIALIVLFFAPVVATAQNCPPPFLYCGPLQFAPVFTSGTVTWTSEAVWDMSTPSFYKTTWTSTGFAVDVSDPTGLGIGHGIGHPIPSGKGFHYFTTIKEHTNSSNLSMTLTIDNVLLPAGFADVALEIDADSGITHAGTYTGAFSMVAFYSPFCGACTTTWVVGGSAPGVLDVVPYPGVPNTFYVDQATFTFSSAPEPSTALLLLLGVAGLAVLGWRRLSTSSSSYIG